MRGPVGRQGVTPSKTGSPLGRAALALSVGASLALGASAVRVFTLSATAPAGDAALAADAPGFGAIAAPPEKQTEQGDQNVRNDQVGQDLSRAQVLALVQRRYRARVVRTSVQQDPSGRRLYVFRLLSAGGKVWTVRIDARSGTEVQ